MVAKCADVFVRDKDRDYQPAIQRVREVIGLASPAHSQQKSVKQIPNDSKVVPKIKKSPQLDVNTRTQPIPKLGATGKTSKSRGPEILSPEGELNGLLSLTQGVKCTEVSLRRAIASSLKCLSECVQQQTYDMFFYC